MFQYSSICSLTWYNVSWNDVRTETIVTSSESAHELQSSSGIRIAPSVSVMKAYSRTRPRDSHNHSNRTTFSS